MERSKRLPYKIDPEYPIQYVRRKHRNATGFYQIALDLRNNERKTVCARDAVGLVIDCIRDQLSTHWAFEGTDISMLNNSSDIGERRRLFRSGG
jgi:hypothetical protein